MSIQAAMEELMETSYRTPGGRKGRAKQAWMRKFSGAVEKAGKSVDWDAAHHYFFQKMDPLAAAKTYLSRRKEHHDWAESSGLLERVRLRLEKKKTYKQARAEILAYLKKEGWAVKDTLKIPHATAPGEWGIGAPASVRLWFKAQAVYYGMGNSFKLARSLHIDDLRTMTPEMFMAHVKRWAK
jgi:hypothetical protein